MAQTTTQRRRAQGLCADCGIRMSITYRCRACRAKRNDKQRPLQRAKAEAARLAPGPNLIASGGRWHVLRTGGIPVLVRLELPPEEETPHG